MPMNMFEKRAAEIIKGWLTDKLEMTADHGGFKLELYGDEPSLAVKLLGEVLMEESKSADANELHACRHERTLVAEELFVVLSALGIGPEQRHSPGDIYSDEAFAALRHRIVEVIERPSRTESPISRTVRRAKEGARKALAAPKGKAKPT